MPGDFHPSAWPCFSSFNQSVIAVQWWTLHPAYSQQLSPHHPMGRPWRMAEIWFWCPLSWKKHLGYIIGTWLGVRCLSWETYDIPGAPSLYFPLGKGLRQLLELWGPLHLQPPFRHPHGLFSCVDFSGQGEDSALVNYVGGTQSA
jgi:hypothetical protein